MAAITATALATGYSAYSASQASKKATKAMLGAQVDPDKVARDTREQSLANIRASLAAEQEFTPENARFRQASVGALMPLLNMNAQGDMTGEVTEDIEAGGTAEQSELLTESIAEARRQLEQGGNLDPATRNEIARRSIASGGNTGRARFLLPRDLGISSLQLQTDRLERGGRFGQVEQNRFQQSFENLNRLRELRSSLAGSAQNRGLQLASFGQSLQAPQIGLDPGEYAGLFTQNQNIASQAAATRAQLDAQNAQNLASNVAFLGGALDTGKPIFNFGKKTATSGTGSGTGFGF